MLGVELTRVCWLVGIGGGWLTAIHALTTICTHKCTHISFGLIPIINLQVPDVLKLTCIFTSKTVFMQKDRNMHTHSFRQIYKAVCSPILITMHGCGYL